MCALDQFLALISQQLKQKHTNTQQSNSTVSKLDFNIRYLKHKIFSQLICTR